MLLEIICIHCLIFNVKPTIGQSRMMNKNNSNALNFIGKLRSNSETPGNSTTKHPQNFRKSNDDSKANLNSFLLLNSLLYPKSIQGKLLNLLLKKLNPNSKKKKISEPEVDGKLSTTLQDEISYSPEKILRKSTTEKAINTDSVENTSEVGEKKLNSTYNSKIKLYNEQNVNTKNRNVINEEFEMVSTSTEISISDMLVNGAYRRSQESNEPGIGIVEKIFNSKTNASSGNKIASPSLIKAKSRLDDNLLSKYSLLMDISDEANAGNQNNGSTARVVLSFVIFCSLVVGFFICLLTVRQKVLEQEEFFLHGLDSGGFDFDFGGFEERNWRNAPIANFDQNCVDSSRKQSECIESFPYVYHAEQREVIRELVHDDSESDVITASFDSVLFIPPDELSNENSFSHEMNTVVTSVSDKNSMTSVSDKIKEPKCDTPNKQVKQTSTGDIVLEVPGNENKMNIDNETRDTDSKKCY